jgi:hypothetical protein
VSVHVYVMTQDACNKADVEDLVYSIKLMMGFGARDISNYQKRGKLKGLMKAETIDGRIHVRPLCTPGDLILALHELMDGNLFTRGCVQLPHSAVSGPYSRDDGGFYRFHYSMNCAGSWQYYRCAHRITCVTRSTVHFDLQNSFFMRPSL